MENNRQIIFWGTPQFSLPSLTKLTELNLVKAVITQADKPAGRNRQLTSSPVKDYALQHNLFLLQPEKLKAEEFLAELKKLLPATFVIVAYGKIIPQIVLDLSELPAINIHPSKLPELRGPSPIQTAILQGKQETAVSLMQLDDKMDHGPILGQIPVSIQPDEDYLSLASRLAEIGAELLAGNIGDYLTGKLIPQIQDDSQATICKLINKEDGQLDFSKTAEELHNQIRAFVAWPGSFTKLKDLDIKIIKSKVGLDKIESGKFVVKDNKLLVGTANQALEIISIQPSGKKVMTAEEFIRGYKKLLV